MTRDAVIRGRHQPCARLCGRPVEVDGLVDALGQRSVHGRDGLDAALAPREATFDGVLTGAARPQPQQRGTPAGCLDAVVDLVDRRNSLLMSSLLRGGAPRTRRAGG